jgi:glucan 1,3-beta-glucosidase
MDVLQGFYQRSNNIIQSGAPHWITLLHDSFRLHHEVWGEFMSRCVNCALDAHLYQAWAWATDPEWFTADACTEGEKLRALEASGLPIVVGEWSLATGISSFVF